MRRLCISCAALLIAAVAVTAAQTPAPGTPRLFVLVVVDQMRASYVERFAADWSQGLNRIVTTGARFTNARYPFLTTVTCAGHATIGTGAFPARHGLIANTWFDRASRQVIACADDPSAKPIGYGGQIDGAKSAHRLLVPTLGDELRRQRGSRVVTMSLKARSAIMLAGHGGEAVTWLNDALDGFETSSAFATAPVPAVQAFIRDNPIDLDHGRTWDRLLPLARYTGPDDAEGEVAPRGWTRTFPHELRSERGRPDSQYFTQWERSPFADAYLGRMATSLARAFDLGRRDAIDLLAVSFSTTDLVGHQFGPRSHEVQDVLAHLDVTLGRLLEDLDGLVGRDRYVLALTADHGVSEIPVQVQPPGESGRLSSARLSEVIERVAQAASGPGRYVARVSGNDVYFEAGMYDKLAASPAAIGAVVKALDDQPGISRVFRREELTSTPSEPDDLWRAAALTYVPGLSGEILIAPAENWLIAGSAAPAANHGTANAYDQHVPLILYGAGIRQGTYGEPATPADIAPTLAHIAGMTLSRAQGRVLREALAPVP